MKFKSVIAAIFAAALSCSNAFGQATILPPGETCFQATAGINGMVGLLGTITAGSGYVNGTYGGVSLNGGSGSNATANITVSGGVVTAVTVLNPGSQYVVGDVLSALAANIGGSGSGFSVPVGTTAINSSLAGGSVGFYIPNSFPSFKQTWQDSGETILNQNPVPLDANGCAVVYGSGAYLMVVKDNLGDTIYSKLTASTGPAGLFWAGQAGGTPNAITITDSGFALQDGATIQFLALSANTGPTTISVSGGGAIAIVKDTSTGPQALSGGEIGPENAPMITYDATNVEFHLVNPATASASTSSTSVGIPQGYLNLVGQASGDVIQTGDAIGVSTIFYSPFTGATVPIWNGTNFRSVTISELTATLTAAGSAASTIQDLCVFSNNGVPTLVIGPAWQNTADGSGSRGTGAGTAQITRLQGLWVNANAIIGYNGLSSYSIPTNQCTYVGSVSIDGSAGQTSAYTSFGQSRKWGIWNAYNRQPIKVQVGDSTSSWTYNTATVRAANGSTNNSLRVFTGLPEVIANIEYTQSVLNTNISAPGSTVAPVQIGIGLNTQTSFSGLIGTNGSGVGTNYNIQQVVTSKYTLGASAIGTNLIYALEHGNATSGLVTTFSGTSSGMLLSASWNG